MATTPVVTVRLEPELRERLDRLAKAQRRSRSFVATEAIREYVKVNEWNDYEVIARGGVMIHIMNGQLMAVFIDDNKDSVNNQPGLIGFEIESQPCKISVRNIWLRMFD